MDKIKCRYDDSTFAHVGDRNRNLQNQPQIGTKTDKSRRFPYVFRRRLLLLYMINWPGDQGLPSPDQLQF